MNCKKAFAKALIMSALSLGAFAQAPVAKLSLNEAIQKGVENSKSLKLSKAKVEEAVSKFKQTKDAALPTAKVSAMYNHAFIPSNVLAFPGGGSFIMPTSADAYIGTASVNQVIFGGYRYKYAQNSATYLQKISELDVEKQRDEIVYNIVQAYFNLYKIKQSQKVVQQTYTEINERLAEAEKLEKQGLATKNDVLKWQLQKSNVDLAASELDANLKVMNYNMDIMLGLPEETVIEPDTTLQLVDSTAAFDEIVHSAFSTRKEFQIADYQIKSAAVALKSARSGLYPTVAAGASLYYLNFTPRLIPASGTFVTPIALGLTVSYDIGAIYTYKNKSGQAKAQQLQSELIKTATEDQVKMEVKQDYEAYKQALSKIRIIQTALAQASENYRMAVSKYKNNLASTADKIDAETMVFQAQINNELAKADAVIAYYKLMKSMGTLN